MESEHYIQSLKKYGPVSEGMSAYLHTVLMRHDYRKNQRLALNEFTNRHYPLLTGGAIRLFTEMDENLSEHTLSFWFKNDFIATLGNKPLLHQTNLHLEFLQDSQVMSIPEKHVLSLLRHFREAPKTFQQYHLEQQAQLLEQLLIRNSMAAPERYKAVLRLQPAIARIATVRDMASYLGIDERTLSRIRSGR
ncbi:hypothetical protein G6M26_27025 [Agrobacterium tumefaciens]|nr:hypothetical protein [Agrobacterium tumefaciens]NTE22208.1 hypothetical protein [Agrobacterium tumefaciens]